MDQTAGTTPTDAPAPAQDANAGAPQSAPAQAAEQPGFSSRGRVRRRARFLRRARELAYRDLGGLVFNLHRFGQRNDALVLAKLNTLGHIDSELRALESALRERRSLTVLREAGITACPRCAAIHGSEDRFCPNCGFSLARHADLPIAGAPSVPAETATAAAPPTVAPQPAIPPQPATVPQPGAPPAPPPPQEQPPQHTTVSTQSASGAIESPAPPPLPDAHATDTGAPAGPGEQRTPGETTEILRPRSGT